MKLFKSLFGTAAVAAACSSNPGFPSECFQTPAGEKLTAYMINHGSIAFSYKGMSIQIDPVSEMDGKKIDYTSFPKADYIFVTHDHYDHLDLKAIETLSKDETIVVLNGTGWEKLRSGKVLNNGDHIEIAEEVFVTAVPAYNNTEDHMKFHPQTRDNGYIFEFDGLRVYVSGDTEDIEEMAEFGKMHVAFLATNQPYTMTPQQCAKAAAMLDPDTVIPYHLGDTDFQALKDALSGFKDVRLHEELR